MKQNLTLLAVFLLVILLANSVYSQTDEQANNYKIYGEALLISDSEITADYRQAIESAIEKISKEKIIFEKSANKEIRYGEKIKEYKGSGELFHFTTADKSYWFDIIVSDHKNSGTERNEYFMNQGWFSNLESTGKVDVYLTVCTEEQSTAGVFINTGKIIFNAGVNIPFGISDVPSLSREQYSYLDKKQEEIYKIVKILKTCFVKGDK